MKRVLLFLFLSLVCATGADKKHKTAKPPDVEVLESSAHRAEGKIAVDGRLRNSSEKHLKGVVLLFDFMAPGHAVVTTQKGPVEDEVLEPGAESSFRMELNDPVRAVQFQINAVDESGRELRV